MGKLTGKFVGVPLAGEKKCPTCKGHGQFWDLDKCDMCDATGVVKAGRSALNQSQEKS